MTRNAALVLFAFLAMLSLIVAEVATASAFIKPSVPRAAKASGAQGSMTNNRDLKKQLLNHVFI